uniref:Capsid protein n=1 Tax=Rodent Torque teno virus 1 TaxID=1514664 RepID=X2G373_9VIRU|nr:ORF1 [Rodent Torque teno virus 1]
MAWRIPRRPTWRRRTYYRKPRRTYRRRTSRRTRRTRRWRRSRKQHKVRVLTEVQPRFSRRCVIRGIACPLMIGQPDQTGTDPTNNANWELRQGAMYGYKSDGSELWMGTWSVGMVSLTMLYGEHKNFRNRWSNSNCGFDMVEYRGTTVYLEQHSTVDYIAFFDEEYRTIESFAQQATLHPFIMLTHPKTILIKSRQRAGPRRARKVFVPRPSWWDSGWKFSKDVCNKGVFVWYIAAVDLEHLWCDCYITDRTAWAEAKWWKDMKWKEDFDTYVRTAVQTIGTDWNKDNYKKTIAHGPTMISIKDFQTDKNNWQITWFYKSYWRFGGNNLTLRKICNPSMDVPIS